MNSMPQMMMSPPAMSARQRSRARVSALHSEAACRDRDRPGISRTRSTVARSMAPAKCVSMAMTTTLMGVALVAENVFSMFLFRRPDGDPDRRQGYRTYGVCQSKLT